MGRPPNRKVARSLEKAGSFEARGLLDAAEPLYVSVLRSEPGHVGALHGLGRLRARQGKLDDAVSLFRQAVAREPGRVEAHNNLGGALHQLGRWQEARDAFQAATAANPDDADLHSNLGVTVAMLGCPAEACAYFERAIALRPTFAAAYNNLGNAQQALGHTGTAMTSFERAIGLRPDYAEAHYNLGSLWLDQGRHDAAIPSLEKALAARPDYAEAYNNLGRALLGLDRTQEARACFERSIAIRPDLAEAHNNLGTVLAALGRNGEAAACYERALALNPSYAVAWSNLGNAWTGLGRETDAISCYERVVACASRDPDAYCNLASGLQALGRLDEARRAIETAVELAPSRLDFYNVLAKSKRFTAGDAHLTMMEALVDRTDSNAERDRANLHFALAKAYDDIEERERSFRHLLTANAFKRRTIRYDEATTLAGFDRIRTIFTSAMMERHRGAGATSSVPVFIVGMPRSGTTLIEQILASHPAVFGAGEIDDFDALVAQLAGPTGQPLAFPEVAAELVSAQFGELGATYLARVRGLAPDATRITDKMPFNCVYAGLIHLALPDARIIHVRRNPIDTCLSCFSTNFVRDHQPFSYDLGELGRCHRAYEAVMAHWRAVLPVGIMLEVHYEEVVDDLEGQARRMLAHCGLPWDSACLAFHAAARSVRTASSVQVRQPIYRSSIARWRPYAHLLTPLFEALGIEPAALA